MFTKEHFLTLYYNQNGYALPTVIAIALIISVITMSIAFSVREKTAVAQELMGRSSASFKSYSAYNEVIYNILTSTFTSTGINIYREDGSKSFWNLYGEPIELTDDVTISLRDTSGMLTPMYMAKKVRMLADYVSNDSKKANSFADALADWQDIDEFKRLNGAESFDYRMVGYVYGPRNFYIQTPREIMLLKGFNADFFEEIRDDLVYWGGGSINYLTMSNRLLAALLHNDSLTKRLIQIRKEGNLTGTLFRSMTGILYTEENIYMPSGWIKLEITAREGKAVDSIKAVVLKRETDRRPFLVTQWKR